MLKSLTAQLYITKSTNSSLTTATFKCLYLNLNLNEYSGERYTYSVEEFNFNFYFSRFRQQILYFTGFQLIKRIDFNINWNLPELSEIPYEYNDRFAYTNRAMQSVEKVYNVFKHYITDKNLLNRSIDSRDINYF